MKLITILVLASLSTATFANVFEDKIEDTELATTLLKCSAETANMLNGYSFVNSVAGKHTKVSKRVDVKTYTISTREPRGFGMSIPGPTLTVKLTVTQPPVGSYDMPSRQEYVCTVK